MGFCGLYCKGSIRIEDIILILNIGAALYCFLCISPQVFQDIGDQYRIDPDQVTRGRLLGRGAFGAVFSGTVHDKVSQLQKLAQVIKRFYF